jgi:hypothetical protein
MGAIIYATILPIEPDPYHQRMKMYGD